MTDGAPVTIRRKVEGLKTAISEASGAEADVKFKEGDTVDFGSQKLEARAHHAQPIRSSSGAAR